MELDSELKVVLCHVFNVLNLCEDVEVAGNTVVDFVQGIYKDNNEYLNLPDKYDNGYLFLSDRFREVCMKYLGYDPE